MIRQTRGTYRTLEKAFQDSCLFRPMHCEQYEPGSELVYDITGLENPDSGTATLHVDKFVGGGFAGQVYQVTLTKLQSDAGAIGRLEVGQKYALKILTPPSSLSRLFRNALYAIGFQGPFQLQVNPDAARSGALWQKFIRRAARIRWGSESTVVDVHATLIDPKMGSCGEISEWVDGRTWRLELDERMDVLRLWSRGKTIDQSQLGSPEYRSKRIFMAEFVRLLHELGAHEFARQYEWTTWKSQPNCLKRRQTEDDPCRGLVAVDFRAGLTLLPFLPMSPGDFKLIGQGIFRGSLVQFDRGDPDKLEAFVSQHEADFADMRIMLKELRRLEESYRNSVPDITHQHIRLLYSRRLWSTIWQKAAVGWRVRSLIDQNRCNQLLNNRFMTFLFMLVSPIPCLGGAIMKFWGRSDYRQHYKHCLGSPRYLSRAVCGKMIESLIRWNRSGRISDERAEKLAMRPWSATVHLPLAILPSGLHRMFTDWTYAKEKLDYLLVRPFRLYFNATIRERWLLDMVEAGKRKNLLTETDAKVIVSQIREPFIQKYLQSLAVHICFMPVTHVVAVACAIVFIVMHPEMPRAQAWAIGLGIIAIFQVVPVSPGSLTRGFYVIYLIAREKNFKDYSIAVFLAFFKYVGYLAFPIQMTQRYPELARFMAGHYATEMVHAVPVFGESGALLEHKIFCLFYNWPLTIRRRMRKRFELRLLTRPRYWHAALTAILGAFILAAVDRWKVLGTGLLPSLKDLWALLVLLPLVSGAAVTLFAGGASLSRRLLAATLTGAGMGLFSLALSLGLNYPSIAMGSITLMGFWRAFLFSILSPVGAMFTELRLPEPKAELRSESPVANCELARRRS